MVKVDDLLRRISSRWASGGFSAVGDIQWRSDHARRGACLLGLTGAGAAAFFSSYTLDAVVAFVGLISYGMYSRWDIEGLGLRRRPIQGWGYWCRVAILLGLMVASVALVAWIVCLTLGIPMFVPQIDVSSPVSWEWGAYALLLAPALEEMVFRFVLCVPIVQRLGRLRTIALSGCIFAVAHVIGGNPGPDNFVAGFILSWTFLKSGTLLIPILLHFAGNLCVVLFGVIMFYWPVFVLHNGT